MEPDKNQPQGKERRRSKRIKGVVVEYSRSSDQEYQTNAFMKDISLIGVCIVTPEEIENDITLQLKVYLPGSKFPIQVEGRVVWHKKSEYLNYFDAGIAFLELGDTDHDKLGDFIDRFDTYDDDE